MTTAILSFFQFLSLLILNIALWAGLDTVRLTTRRMTILILFYHQMEIEFMVRYKKYKIRRLYDNYKR